MAKAIIQHFQELELEIRKKAVRNTIKNKGIKKLRDKYSSTSSAIAHSFNWESSPEGYKYWRDIYNTFIKKGH